MKILSVSIILLLSTFTFAQKPENFACSKDDKPRVREYFEKVQMFAQVQADCRNLFLENGNLPLFDLAYSNCHLSNNGCPVSLVLPKISDSMRRFQLFGEVKVEIIVEESGEIFSAQTLNGHPLLRKSAREAACNSRFSPKSFCGKPVMQKRVIHYNFIH